MSLSASILFPAVSLRFSTVVSFFLFCPLPFVHPLVHERINHAAHTTAAAAAATATVAAAATADYQSAAASRYPPRSPSVTYADTAYDHSENDNYTDIKSMYMCVPAQ